MTNIMMKSTSEVNFINDKIMDFLTKWAGITVITFLIIILYFVAIVLTDKIYDDPTTIFLLSLFAKLCVFEIGGNLFCLKYCAKFNHVANWKHYMGSKKIQKDIVYKGCGKCVLKVPHRSHHCPICDYCVLRKDHHCHLTGTCVGIANQRYFICFLFWISFSLAIAIPHLLYLLAAEKSASGVLTALVSIGTFKLTESSTRGIWLAAVSTFLTIIWSCATGFVGFQIYYVCKGYSEQEYEYYRKYFDGDGETVGERLRLIFGEYWALNFILPLPWRPNKLTPSIVENIFRTKWKDV